MLIEFSAGFAAKAVAFRLGISAHTVYSHSDNIKQKLGVASMAGAAAKAAREGLI